MRLYYHPASSSSRRVMLAAVHMGTALELTEVNLMSPEDRRRLVALNPNSKVPVLQDGEFTLWESCAIMQYWLTVPMGKRCIPTTSCARRHQPLDAVGAALCAADRRHRLRAHLERPERQRRPGPGGSPSGRAKLPVTQYPKLMAWLARVSQLDAWKQTMPVW
jgi:glutathione S-transferase